MIDPMSGLLWSGATIATYLAAKRLHGRWPGGWRAPIILTPLCLILLVWGTNTPYAEYDRATHWLGWWLGPASVAFALPIYDHRHLIRRHWPVLVLGILVGSTTAILSAWGLAQALGLDDSLCRSLLPRSVSTPFAVTVSSKVGGIPEMTALFVIVTGILGAALGEAMVRHLPLRTTLARGALLGMGAHAVGVAKAHQLGAEEGSIAGLIMILVGITNVMAAPFVAGLL